VRAQQAIELVPQRSIVPEGAALRRRSHVHAALLDAPEILAVNTTFQDTQTGASEFASEFGLIFPVALDRGGEASRAYLLRALPTTFFIDRSGVIRQVVFGGPLRETTIQTAVEELLREESVPHPSDRPPGPPPPRALPPGGRVAGCLLDRPAGATT